MARADIGETGLSDESGSEDLYDLVCTPCLNKVHLEKAVGMCIYCQEYLCQRCYDAHTIPTPMQHHELLGKKQMIQNKIPLKQKDICTEICNVHDTEVLQYTYCTNHCQFGCSTSSCYKSTYILSSAKDLDNNEELKQTEDMLKSVITRYKKVIENAKKQTMLLNVNCFDAIERIQEFRREINKAFDKLESDLIEKAESLKSEEIKKVENQIDTFRYANIDLQSTLDELDRLNNNEQNCNLYTLMMKTKNRLKVLWDEVHASENEQSLINSQIQFMANREILNTLKNPNILGAISCSNTQVESNGAENEIYE